MKLTFLGTGTSFGIPVVGCDCDTCTSDDPRDRRTRHGALLELDEGTLLVDTPPGRFVGPHGVWRPLRAAHD